MGASFKRYLQGKRAKYQGIQFESILETIAKFQNILCIRMPDGCRQVGKFKLIRVRTPFDFILVYKGVTVFLDCKSLDSDRISFSQLTDHQVWTLRQIQDKGVTAGYLIWLRDENAVCFAPADRLANMTKDSSLHGSEMVYLGSIDEFYLGRLFSFHLEKNPGLREQN